MANKKATTAEEIDLTHIFFWFFAFPYPHQVFSQPLERGSCFVRQTTTPHTIATLKRSVYKIPQKLTPTPRRSWVSCFDVTALECEKKSNKFYEFSISLATHDCITRQQSLSKNFTILFCCCDALWRLDWGSFTQNKRADLLNTKFVETFGVLESINQLGMILAFIWVNI